jgi:hypothetical protein
MNTRKMILRFCLAAFCLTASLFGADHDLFNGTWKLNVAKSKLPLPAPESEIGTHTGENGSHTLNTQIKMSSGETIEMSYTAKDDGTPAPVAGLPMADTISVRWINEHLVERKFMKADKTVSQDRATLSTDGKVITVTGSGVNEKGIKTPFTAVYEKQ